MPTYNPQFKRSQILAVAHSSDVFDLFPKISPNINGNKVDAYRDAGAIPSAMYERPKPDERIGYQYATEAGDWLAFAFVLERSLGLRGREVGAILEFARAKFDTELNAIIALYDANVDLFLCNLIAAGVKFSDQFAYLHERGQRGCSQKSD